uniref:Uncharacterized protein n=1 Tax=Parascaris equorum TaxID=6256 RepID=A0A914RFD1_PAREQ
VRRVLHTNLRHHLPSRHSSHLHRRAVACILGKRSAPYLHTFQIHRYSPTKKCTVHCT